MRKRIIILAVALLALTLSACNSESSSTPQSSTRPNVNTSSSMPETSPNVGTAYVYHLNANEHSPPEPKIINFEYIGFWNLDTLVQGLEGETGLDFGVSSYTQNGDILTIDFSSDSYLFKTIDDYPMSDKYHFNETDKMRWFILDSLWYSVTHTLDVSEVIYTMDGGKELLIEDMFMMQGNGFGDSPYRSSTGYGEYLVISDELSKYVRLDFNFANGRYGNEITEYYKRESKSIYVNSTNYEDFVFQIADEFTAYTGLNFSLNGVIPMGSRIFIDWSSDASLFSGISGLNQFEHFTFTSDDALRWFMLDSMHSTIVMNTNFTEVYFTMNDSKSLVLPGLSPKEVFTTDDYYVGSAEYFTRHEMGAPV